MRRKLDLRVRHPDTETGEVFTDKTEKAMYKRLGYPWIPPELRENMGELEAAREGRLPTRRADRHSRRPALALDVVVGRQEHDRGDGERGEAARPLVHRRHRPLALPPRRRLEAQSKRSTMSREARPLQAPERRRSQHQGRRFDRRGRRGARGPRLGDGVGPLGVRQGPDGARPVRDGQPERRLHRAPDRAQAEPARARRRRPRARRRGALETGRSSRSTPSRTGSTSATHAGSRARPASRS